MEAKLRGHTETMGERMERDLDALLPPPAVPYDPSDRHTTRVISLSLVRYRTKEFLMLHATLGTRAPRPGSLRSTTVIDNIFQTTRPW